VRASVEHQNVEACAPQHQGSPQHVGSILFHAVENDNGWRPSTAPYPPTVQTGAVERGDRDVFKRNLAAAKQVSEVRALELREPLEFWANEESRERIACGAKRYGQGPGCAQRYVACKPPPTPTVGADRSHRQVSLRRSACFVIDSPFAQFLTRQ
jgi:hypothetical protein